MFSENCDNNIADIQVVITQIISFELQNNSLRQTGMLDFL